MNKNIMALLLTIATALGAPTIVDEVTDTTPAPAIALDAPVSVEVGELARLTYAARKVEWKLPGSDYEIDGQRAWISFREPGVYQIIVSGLVDNDVRLVDYKIKVNGPVVPVEPVVVVDEPVPTPEPNKPTFDLVDKVVEWCQEAGTTPEVARSLGGNFVDAATNSTTVSELMQSIAAKNKSTDQTGAQDVLVKVQVWLIENLTGKGFVDHQCALSEVGDGFLKYAEGK